MPPRATVVFICGHWKHFIDCVWNHSLILALHSSWTCFKFCDLSSDLYRNTKIQQDKLKMFLFKRRTEYVCVHQTCSEVQSLLHKFNLWLEKFLFFLSLLTGGMSGNRVRELSVCCSVTLILVCFVRHSLLRRPPLFLSFTSSSLTAHPQVKSI